MLREGDRLADRYRLEQEQGRGAHGVVFRAHDAGLQRTVAVKQLLMASPTLLARFLQEGRVIASLSHPAIVEVYDLLLDQDPPCLVLEWLPGESLAARLEREGPVSSDEARRLMRSLAEGLDHAHRYGVLHRDVKPDNVLFDAAGEPKLTDFGLAKPQAVPEIEDTGELQIDADLRASLTAANGLLGTPSYMAPEQARGDIRRIGPWSDVYALGATIYEALTGSPPFVRTSLLELIVALQSLEPDPPSRRTRRPIDPAVEQACLACLARDPADRPTAAEVSASLRRSASSQRVAVERSPSRRLEAAGRRWWPLAALVVGVVAAVGVAIARREPAPRPVAARHEELRAPAPSPSVEPTATPTPRPTTPRKVESSAPAPTSKPISSPRPRPWNRARRTRVPSARRLRELRSRLTGRRRSARGGRSWKAGMRAPLLPRPKMPPGWLDQLVRGGQYFRSWARSWSAARREATARKARVVVYLSIGDDAWLPPADALAPGDAVPVYARATPHDAEPCPVVGIACASHVRVWETIVETPPRVPKILVCTAGGRVERTVQGGVRSPRVSPAEVARKGFKLWARQVQTAGERLGDGEIRATLGSLAKATQSAPAPIDAWARSVLGDHAKAFQGYLLRASASELRSLRAGLTGVPPLEITWQAASRRRKKRRDVTSLLQLLAPIGADPYAPPPPVQSWFLIRDRKGSVIGYGQLELTPGADGTTIGKLEHHWRGARNALRSIRETVKLGRYYERLESTRVSSPGAQTAEVRSGAHGGFRFVWRNRVRAALNRSCTVEGSAWDHGSLLSALLLARRAPPRTDRYELRAVRWPELWVVGASARVISGTYPPAYARARLSVLARSGAVRRVELTYGSRAGWTVTLGPDGAWQEVQRRGFGLTLKFVSKEAMKKVRSTIGVPRGSAGPRKD